MNLNHEKKKVNCNRNINDVSLMHTMWGQIQQCDSSLNLFDCDVPSVENHSTTVHSAFGRHRCRV